MAEDEADSHAVGLVAGGIPGHFKSFTSSDRLFRRSQLCN